MATFWKPNSNAIVDRETNKENVAISNKYKHLNIQQQRLLLPVYRHRNHILYTLEKYNILVIVGETGCGKSTQIPQYLHESGWTDGFRIVCTQVRKVAVITVARRVAQEMGVVLGSVVGYGVRFDYQCSDASALRYYTDGVLLRETLSDPFLSKYSVIIVDEVHQRTMHSDILLGVLKKIQLKRPELRLVIMSATMDAQFYKNFFESNSNKDKPELDSARILSIQGRQHSVDILYLNTPTRNYVKCAVDTVLSIHEKEKQHGDILVFLPSGEEVDMAIRLLNDSYTGNTMYFLPLYGALSNDQQLSVFEPTPSTHRKVVVATNIAETSITIEGINYVIDCGFEKLNFFDVESGIEALITCPISKETAIQRAGRAGRTQSGKCFRLMPEEAFDNLQQTSPPEIQRVDITMAILQLKLLGIKDIIHFDFITCPSVESLIFSLELLYSLKGVDENGDLTTIGIQMAEMPVEPRIACCLISSFEFGCVDEILSIAAMCAVDYPFKTIRNKTNSNLEQRNKIESDISEFVIRESDHLTLLNVFQSFKLSHDSKEWCDQHSVIHKVMVRATEIRLQLQIILKKYMGTGFVTSSSGEDMNTVKKCLVKGFFSHAAKLSNDGYYRTVRGSRKVSLYSTSIVARYGAPPEWVIFDDVFLSKTEIFIREVSKINPLWLAELAPHYYTIRFK